MTRITNRIDLLSGGARNSANALGALRRQLQPKLTQRIGYTPRSFRSFASWHRTQFRDSRGDTIIEVLISVAILATIFGVAFASSGQSLQQGTDASNRNHALQIAEQQISIVKNSAQAQGQPPTYPANQPFCLKSDGSVDTADIDSNTKTCNFANQSPFGVADRYNSQTKTFTAKVTWPGTRNITDRVQLYYHSLNTQGS